MFEVQGEQGVLEVQVVTELMVQLVEQQVVMLQGHQQAVMLQGHQQAEPHYLRLGQVEPHQSGHQKVEQPPGQQQVEMLQEQGIPEMRETLLPHPQATRNLLPHLNLVVQQVEQHQSGQEQVEPHQSEKQ